MLIGSVFFGLHAGSKSGLVLQDAGETAGQLIVNCWKKSLIHIYFGNAVLQFLFSFLTLLTDIGTFS